MNVVILIGRLARDPERFDRSGTTVCSFTIAVDRMKDGADFIRITTFGRTAEVCAQNLAKGRMVGINGRIQTGSYQKDGQTIYTTDVVADRVEFLGGKSQKEEPRQDADSWGSYQDDGRLF